MAPISSTRDRSDQASIKQQPRHSIQYSTENEGQTPNLSTSQRASGSEGRLAYTSFSGQVFTRGPQTQS